MRQRLHLAGPFLMLVCLFLGGCWRDMYEQPRYDPYEPSGLFRDSMSARPLVPGTVPRQAVIGGEAIPLLAAQAADSGAVVVTEALVNRGRQRYMIFCSPCHGGLGGGDGIIVQHGFTAPPSFHSARLRAAPDQHFFDVITHGIGRMYSYADRVPPADRWAIIAYIRRLQHTMDGGAATAAAGDTTQTGGGRS